MRIHKLTAVSAMIISALAISAGTSTAAPAPAAPDLHFQAKTIGRSMVLTTDVGSPAVRDNQLQLLDRNGTSVAAVPLAYIRHGKQMPIAAHLDGNTVTLTPGTDPASARPVEPAIAKQIDALSHPNFNAALGNFSMSMMAAATTGSLLGTAVGASVGCVAGGIVGGLAGGVVSVGLLALPGVIGGCLVTGAALGAMGAMAGTIIVGLPVLIAAGTAFWNDTH